MDTNATDGKVYGYADVESYESFATNVEKQERERRPWGRGS
jgi:hypothetical protein